MRALRTFIVVLVVALGFLGGYFVGWYLHGENSVRLNPGQANLAFLVLIEWRKPLQGIG